LNNLADEFVCGHASVEIYDKGQFGYQDYLLPLNRWPEEVEINAQVAASGAHHTAIEDSNQ